MRFPCLISALVVLCTACIIDPNERDTGDDTTPTSSGTTVTGADATDGTGAAGAEGDEASDGDADTADTADTGGDACEPDGTPGTCVPDEQCGGLTDCVDACYGDDCCFLNCDCDPNTCRLACQLVCETPGTSTGDGDTAGSDGGASSSDGGR